MKRLNEKICSDGALVAEHQMFAYSSYQYDSVML